MELFAHLPHAPRPKVLRDAVDALSAEDAEGRGAVFTLRPVVELLLDLAGYTADRDLAALRLLEPSCGSGDFLIVAVQRLWSSFSQRGGSARDARTLRNAMRAVEVHRDSARLAKESVQRYLSESGVSDDDASDLVNSWVVCDDFLLTEDLGTFDVVVGNPPYVRQERVPAPLMKEYRRRFKTIYDRADLYVPFYERSLDLLRADGRLAFICANRWIKNRFGKLLRGKIATAYRLRVFIDMERSTAFQEDVLAYPAITVIGREAPGTTVMVTHPPNDLRALAERIGRVEAGGRVDGIRSAPFARDDGPWVEASGGRPGGLTALEAEHPTLEEAGCRVGIGVGTGLDRVFIGPYDALPVEPERKLRLAMAKDLDGSELRWRGMGVVNPFEPDGRLVDPERWPKFQAWLREHEAGIAARHCAKANPGGWFRTIDRIWTGLTDRPKLLIPDIKGGAAVALDPGGLYPHHNLYHITSEEWDLRALAVVLRSPVAVAFVRTYGVQMAGGFLRFQAQYLRRIRIPRWETVPTDVREALKGAFSQGSGADDAVRALYRLDDAAWRVVVDTAVGTKAVAA